MQACFPISSTFIINISYCKMNHLQAENMREMEEFKSANNAYGSELLKLENNNKHITRSGHYGSSEDQVRRHVPDYCSPPPSSSSSSTASTWNKNNKMSNYQIQRKSGWINDPEVKRQKRVVKYKAYAVEGKVKASLRNGFHWVKNKYIQLMHGY